MDLKGKEFGRWTVIGKAEPRFVGGKWRPFWKCYCECLYVSDVKQSHLVSGHSQGCVNRCWRVRKPKVKKERLPSLRDHPLASVLKGMRRRCYDPKERNFPNYGGRGIKICDRWKNSLRNFVEDMFPSYRPGLSIERRDNNGNYTPENCHWITMFDQAGNKRTNRKLTYNGETMCLARWARRLGISKSSLRNRLKRGWSMEEACSRGKHPRFRKSV